MPTSKPQNLRTLHEISRQDICFAVARVPNSDRLLVPTSDGKVFEINAVNAKGEAKALANHGRYVNAVALADGVAISGGYDNRLIWWDVAKESVIRTVAAHTRQIRQIAVSPDKTKIASVADDMICRVWNVSTGAKLHDLVGHAERTPTNFTTMLYACTFSPDGRHIATGDRIGHIIVWETATGRKVAEMDAPLLYTWDGTQRIRSIGGIRALAFSPDNNQLAAGGVGQIGNVDSLAGPARVEIFDWQKRTRVHEFTGNQGMLTRLIYHPTANWIFGAGGGGNGIALFYDLAKRAMLHQANQPMFVHDAVFNEDYTKLYCVGHNKIAVSELKE